MGENDHMIFKAPPIAKNIFKEKKKTKKTVFNPKQEKKSKKLFNNPFNDLTKFNA